MHHLYSIDFPNGKRYIGITDYPPRRFAAYRNAVKRGSTKQKVHLALSKYGIENVEFRILVKGSEAYIRDLEKKAIALFNTRDHNFGYNMAIGGENSPVAGIGHTEVSKRKMSESQKRRIRDPEELAKFASNRLGKPVNDLHKQRLSEAAKARWKSCTETKAPITIQRIELIKGWLKEGLSRKEIAVRLNLSKPRVRSLVLQASIP